MLSDPAAERGINAGICKFGKDALFEVSDLLQSKSFTVDLNENLYVCLAYILERNIEAKIDLHLILSAANELGLSFSNDTTFLQRILGTNVELTNLRGYAQKIKKLEIARQLVEKHDESKAELKTVTGSESISQIIAKSENPILDFVNGLSGNVSGTIQIADGLESFLQNVCEKPQDIIGVSSGHGYYDKAIGGGFRRKSVYVVAARPGVGKTLLSDSTALHVAGGLKIPVLMLDTEMDETGHWPRIIAKLSKTKTYAGITIDEIESGKYSLDPLKKNRVGKIVESLKSIPYSYRNVCGMEMPEMLSVVRRWLFQTVKFDKSGRLNDCLLIYDYFKLMNDGGIKDGHVKEYQALGFQFMELHNFIVKYDLPCLSFIQVNRDGITKDTSDVIADSDRILRYAASVALYREKRAEEIAEDGKDAGNRAMFILKARYGGGLDWNDYICFKHTKEIGLIEELGTKNGLRNKQMVAVDDQPIPDF